MHVKTCMSNMHVNMLVKTCMSDFTGNYWMAYLMIELKKWLLIFICFHKCKGRSIAFVIDRMKKCLLLFALFAQREE